MVISFFFSGTTKLNENNVLSLLSEHTTSRKQYNLSNQRLAQLAFKETNLPIVSEQQSPSRKYNCSLHSNLLQTFLNRKEQNETEKTRTKRSLVSRRISLYHGGVLKKTHRQKKNSRTTFSLPKWMPLFTTFACDSNAVPRISCIAWTETGTSMPFGTLNTASGDAWTF